MDYKYSVLRYQPSLATSEPENFAVLVQGKIGARTVLFMVWRAPESDPAALNELGRAVSDNLPEVITNVLSDPSNQNSRGDALDCVYNSMRWNYQATPPRSVHDEDQIHRLAFKLFADNVAGADRLIASLEEASRRTLRMPRPKQNLGRTFAGAVSVSEPEPMAAD